MSGKDIPVRLINDIPVWGVPDDGAVKQMVTVAKTADYTALMADHHLGYSVPIGGVVAYKNAISPSGVGFDIACGNKAVRLDIRSEELKPRIKEVMDLIWENLEFGIGRKNQEKVDDALFDDLAWKIPEVKKLKEKARNQLGTIGSGNHYVDIFEDEKGRIWVGVHFGSRGLGHGIATHFIKAGGGKDGMHVEPVVLHAESDLGEQYLQAMELAGKYAYAGRNWVCQKVADLLGGHIEEEIHNHHNFAWREKHFDEWCWVVRKGATPGFPGQKGFVGGSMGDISVILEGVESKESQVALYSTVHGAGRVMSRTRAAGKTIWKNGRPERRESGEISRKMMMNWVKEHEVELRGAGTDESPHCYKRLPEVLHFHRNTIKILHTLKPLGVAMAGEDEFDPYKD